LNTYMLKHPQDRHVTGSGKKNVCLWTNEICSSWIQETKTVFTGPRRRMRRTRKKVWAGKRESDASWPADLWRDKPLQINRVGKGRLEQHSSTWRTRAESKRRVAKLQRGIQIYKKNACEALSVTALKTRMTQAAAGCAAEEATRTGTDSAQAMCEVGAKSGVALIPEAGDDKHIGMTIHETTSEQAMLAVGVRSDEVMLPRAGVDKKRLGMMTQVRTSVKVMLAGGIRIDAAQLFKAGVDKRVGTMIRGKTSVQAMVAGGAKNGVALMHEVS